MDDCEIVPFSSVVSGLLLCNSNICAKDIVNFIAKLSFMGYVVDDSDDLLELLKYIDIDKGCSFRFKEGLCYGTVLENGTTLFQYLENVAGDSVLNCIKNDDRYGTIYWNNYCIYHFNNQKNRIKCKPKKRKFNFSFVSGFHV